MPPLMQKPASAPPRPQVRTEPHPVSRAHAPKLTLRVSARLRSVPFLLIIGVAVVGILATLMIFKPGSGDVGPIVSPTGETRLAVLSLLNDTGEPVNDIWCRAFGHALATDLSQATSYEVVPGEQMFMALKRLNMQELSSKEHTTADLQKIARRTGALYIAGGRLHRNSGMLELQLDLMDASKGRTLASKAIGLAGPQELLSLVDDAATHLRESMPQAVNGAGTADSDLEFQEYTTSSHEAYASYASGKWYQWNQNYRRSIDAFEQAIELDPEFAAAYIGAAESYTSLGYLDKGWQKCQAAQRLVDRLSEQDRLHLQGEFYRRSEKTFDIALKVYSRLIELYPDDSRAHTNLGILYSNLGDWDRAYESFTANRRNQVMSWNLSLGISQAYTLQQDYEAAAENLRAFLRESYDSEEIHFQLAWIFLLKGDYDSALDEIKRGRRFGTSYTSTRMQGEILLMQGELKAAEAQFNTLLQDSETIAQLWGRKRLADLYLLGGQFSRALDQLNQGVRLAAESQEMGWKYRLHLDLARIYLETGKASKAMQQCDAAWSIAVQGDTMDLPRDALHYRGLCYLALKRMRDAERTADRLRGLCEKGPVKDRMRYYYHLMGEIEMARNNPPQAVGYFVQAVNLLPPQGAPWLHSNDHALFIDALAEAYYAADNPIKALEEFENARDLTSGRLLYGDLYAKIYYKLGKIREEYGLNDIAGSGYQKFLELWEDADPQLPEKRDAQKRLAAARGR